MNLLIIVCLFILLFMYCGVMFVHGCSGLFICLIVNPGFSRIPKHLSWQNESVLKMCFHTELILRFAKHLNKNTREQELLQNHLRLNSSVMAK